MSPTHLEDAVSAYNSIANELQEAYDAYAVALTEFAVEYKKQMDYRRAIDAVDPDGSRTSAEQTAIGVLLDLANAQWTILEGLAPSVDRAVENFTVKLSQVRVALELVEQVDEADRSYTASDVGTWFEFTADSEINWWREYGSQENPEWPAARFPILAVIAGPGRFAIGPDLLVAWGVVLLVIGLVLLVVWLASTVDKGEEIKERVAEDATVLCDLCKILDEGEDLPEDHPLHDCAIAFCGGPVVSGMVDCDDLANTPIDDIHDGLIRTCEISSDKALAELLEVWRSGITVKYHPAFDLS